MAKVSLPDGLEAVINSTIRAAVLAAAVPGSTGPQRVEQLTGATAGTISRWGGDYDTFMPLDVVFLLEFTAQVPVFARALAALTGHRLVPVDGSEDTDGSELGDLLALTASHSDVMKTYAVSLADGKLTPRERGEIRARLSRLSDAIAVTERRLNAVGEA